MDRDTGRGSASSADRRSAPPAGRGPSTSPPRSDGAPRPADRSRAPWRDPAGGSEPDCRAPAAPDGTDSPPASGGGTVRPRPRRLRRLPDWRLCPLVPLEDDASPSAAAPPAPFSSNAPVAVRLPDAAVSTARSSVTAFPGTAFLGTAFPGTSSKAVLSGRRPPERGGSSGRDAGPDDGASARAPSRPAACPGGSPLHSSARPGAARRAFAFPSDGAVPAPSERGGRASCAASPAASPDCAAGTMPPPAGASPPPPERSVVRSSTSLTLAPMGRARQAVVADDVASAPGLDNGPRPPPDDYRQARCKRHGPPI